MQKHRLSVTLAALLLTAYAVQNQAGLTFTGGEAGGAGGSPAGLAYPGRTHGVAPTPGIASQLFNPPTTNGAL